MSNYEIGMAIAIVIITGLSAWENSKAAKRYERKMIALMEYMDSLGMGRQAIEVVRKA